VDNNRHVYCCFSCFSIDLIWIVIPETTDEDRLLPPRRLARSLLSAGDFFESESNTGNNVVNNSIEFVRTIYKGNYQYRYNQTLQR